MLFFRSFRTCHERATAWLFHVGASQNYFVSHLSSRRGDGGLTVQMSCLTDKPEGRCKGGGTTSVIYVLIHSKLQAHAVVYSAYQIRGQGGMCSAPWGYRSPRVAKLLRMSNVLQYLHQATRHRSEYTCERTTVASRDSIGPNIQHAFVSQAYRV